MWITYSILSALTMAVVNIADKFILTRWARTPLVPLLVLGWIGLLPAPLVLVLRGFPPVSSTGILLSAAAGAAFALMSYFYFSAVKVEEISRIVPIYYLSPLFVSLLAGLFLGETFPVRRYLGVVLLVGGAMLISAGKGPVFRPGKGFRLMVLAALSMALYMTILKSLLATLDFWTVFALTRLATFLALLPFSFLHSGEVRTAVRENGIKVLAVLTLNEALALAGALLGVLATSTGFATLVMALCSVQPFFVLLFTIVLTRACPGLIREETAIRVVMAKAAAISLMFLGGLLAAA